jgi:predicted nucleic acid-binding protein
VKYLVDTSALLRIYRRQVDPVWHDLVGRGLVSVCEPVLTEALVSAKAREYASLEEEFRETYLVATVPDGVWDLVAVLRRELARHSAHQAMSVADYVIAATAMKLKLELLHEDGDFETLAKHVPELAQRRISASPN